ncbi:asparaginase domain-containing protein [Rossellomorea aquimaris]|uniref:asparaginase domain-containing protein n=1 Tax=Rossellomorea aquimaris TaxID=189382 RepID=UPI0009EF34DE|nr:asparaginase domain-containing protein [Rossellomorea aquimaris]
MKKNILVIHTGGTISMMEDVSTGEVIPGKENPLSVQTSIVSNLANITVEEAFHLPSPHITEQHMYQLKELIEEKYKEKAFDGAVITHGTDTLEETAYFLDLTISLPISIVVTGAMRSSNEIGADGLYNLISSVRVAADSKSKNKGVLVVLNDEIHSAKNVTKHTQATFLPSKARNMDQLELLQKEAYFFTTNLLPLRAIKFAISQNELL